MTVKPRTEVRYGKDGIAVTESRRHDAPAPEPEREPTDLERYADILAATPKEDERADSDHDDATPKPGLSYFEQHQLDQAREAADAEWKQRFEKARAYLKGPIKARELDASHTPLPTHPALEDTDA